MTRRAGWLAGDYWVRELCRHGNTEAWALLHVGNGVEIALSCVYINCGIIPSRKGNSEYSVGDINKRMLQSSSEPHCYVDNLDDQNHSDSCYCRFYLMSSLDYALISL